LKPRLSIGPLLIGCQCFYNSAVLSIGLPKLSLASRIVIFLTIGKDCFVDKITFPSQQQLGRLRYHHHDEEAVFKAVFVTLEKS
jgi:hypothetical protein